MSRSLGSINFYSSPSLVTQPNADGLSNLGGIWLSPYSVSGIRLSPTSGSLTTRWPGWMRGRVQEAKKRRHLATLAEPLRSGKSVRPCCSFYPPPTRSPPHICIQRHSKGPRPDLCSQIPSQLCGANFFRCSVDNRHGKGMYIVKNYKRQTTPKLLIFFLSHCKTAQLYFSSPKYESIILQSI